MLGTGLDLPTLAARRSGRWYRPDDVLRILPGTNRAMVRLASGAVAEGTIETLIALGYLSYSRTGSAWAADRSGARREFASNQPRITDAGMTIEPAATNFVRNNSMQGALAGIIGAGGAFPANWGSSSGGVTREVAAIGTDGGIDYIDLRFYGTASGGGWYVRPEALTAIAAAASQAWTTTVFLKLLRNAGPSLLSDVRVGMLVLNSGVSQIGSSAGPNVFASLSGTAWTMASWTYASTPADTAYIVAQISSGAQTFAGQAIDFTIRIGWPQAEIGAFATTPIRTTGAAATRAADDFRCPASGLLLPASGTLVAEFVPGASLDASYTGETYAIGIDDGGNARLALRAHGTGKGPRLVVGDGEGVATVGPATGVAAGGVCRAVATFGAAAAGDNRLSVNGIFAGASERRCVFDLPAAIGLGQVHNGGAGFMSGVAREWAIRSTVLTADDSNAESARYTA